MDPILVGLFCFVGLLVCIISGVWIAVALVVVGLVTAYVLQIGVLAAVYIPWSSANNFILTAMPLFLLMGNFLLHSGASERIYQGASRLLSWVPGGLLHSNIGACSLFAAISGSSAATAATISTVATPSLIKRHYDRKLLLGSLAAGGTLGVLIPPSVNMIIYGAISGTSVGMLFAGGVIPGLVLSSMFMIYIGIRAVLNPRLAPKEKAFSLKDLPLSFLDLWPALALVVLVIGGIFSGFATPTEAAALGASAALLIGLGQRKLTWQNLWVSLMTSVTTVCMCVFIFIGANILGTILVAVGLTHSLANLITSLAVPPVVVILLVCCVYILLGCLMDGLSIIVVTTPIILPALVIIGFDPVWFGVLLVVLTETAMLTPPVGPLLFIIQAVSECDLVEVTVGAMPFFLIQVILLLLVIAFPNLVMWLPLLLFRN